MCLILSTLCSMSLCKYLRSYVGVSVGIFLAFSIHVFLMEEESSVVFSIVMKGIG